MEKLWPALEHVDSSSGALGSAVNKALDVLIPIIIKAPADEKTRDNWLDRLWRAMADDGVDYLSPVGDRWGEICGSAEVAGRWADELVSTLRACWADPNPGGYYFGAAACLSCLLVTDRYQELLALLALPRYPSWHYRRYGVEALLALGGKADAIQYAEASRGLNQPDAVIDQTCKTSKWFATAKELKLYDLALELANRTPCDPKTLTNAARDYLDMEPAFALGSAMTALHWLSEGWGYEVTGADVVEAYDRAMDAAARLNNIEDVAGQIRQLVESNESTSVSFVRQSLHGRLRAYLSSVHEM